VRTGGRRCRAKTRSARIPRHRDHPGACAFRGRDPACDRVDFPSGQPPVEATGRAMKDDPFSLWVYLSQSPLLWLTVTLLVYATTDAVSLATRRHPFANPVLHAMWIIGAFLLATGTSYTTYFAGAQFVHFLLGPATVALAVPLYQNRVQVRQALTPMLAALAAGSATAIVSAVVVARVFGATAETLSSLAPKSASTPIALGLSEQVGGLPS